MCLLCCYGLYVLRFPSLICSWFRSTSRTSLSLSLVYLLTLIQGYFKRVYYNALFCKGFSKYFIFNYYLLSGSEEQVGHLFQFLSYFCLYLFKGNFEHVYYNELVCQVKYH